MGLFVHLIVFLLVCYLHISPFSSSCEGLFKHGGLLTRSDISHHVMQIISTRWPQNITFEPFKHHPGFSPLSLFPFGELYCIPQSLFHRFNSVLVRHFRKVCLAHHFLTLWCNLLEHRGQAAATWCPSQKVPGTFISTEVTEESKKASWGCGETVVAVQWWDH